MLQETYYSTGMLLWPPFHNVSGSLWAWVMLRYCIPKIRGFCGLFSVITGHTVTFLLKALREYLLTDAGFTETDPEALYTCAGVCILMCA